MSCFVVADLLDLWCYFPAFAGFPHTQLIICASHSKACWDESSSRGSQQRPLHQDLLDKTQEQLTFTQKRRWVCGPSPDVDGLIGAARCLRPAGSCRNVPCCPVCSWKLIVFPSQELLERFMEASLGLEDFLDSFQSSRRTYHLRRAQAEKIQEVSEARQQQPEKSKAAEESQASEGEEKVEQPRSSHLPNGFIAQGPLRVFQVRYGLRPAILLPHYNVSTSSSLPASQASSPPAEAHLGQRLSPTSPLPGPGQAVGLRLIGQLPGGWPASGRALRLQQLYRLSPQQTEPPFR